VTWFKQKTRVADWQLRLNAVFTKYEFSEFKWGHTDCFCFASDCIKAMTNYGPMDGFKGLYGTETEANALLQNGGVGIDNNFYRYNGVIGFWSAFLGAPKNIGGAMVGDIVLTHIPKHDLVAGVVNDTGRFIYLKSLGQDLIEVPIQRTRYIWGV
tara:strand:- start:295 stop:759 length:465 start_codon:yes stop_codon:yes gene_type:complete